MKIELTLKVDKKVLFKVDNDSYGKMPLKGIKTNKMWEVVTFLIKVASSLAGSGAGLLHANGMPKREVRRYFKKIEGLFKMGARDSFNMATKEYKRLEPNKMLHLTEKPNQNPFIFKIKLYSMMFLSVLMELPAVLGTILSGGQVEIKTVAIDPRDKEYQKAVKEGPEAVERLVRKIGEQR